VLPALCVQQIGQNAVITSSDPTLSIQSATNALGPYVTVTGATTPYTNGLTTNAMQFFRFQR
jgi:hypothetical protein